MITLVKLGGSLLTDKLQESSFRFDQTHRIAHEIAAAMSENSNLKLVIGHGSGSFGHFAANRHGTIHGVKTPQEWIGFADVAFAAAELNQLVLIALRSTGIPAFKIQTSATSLAENGRLIDMNLDSIKFALEQRLVPLVYGDVAFDAALGGTIVSTETIFTYLAQNLPVSSIILVGEVDGVYDDQGQTIPEITPKNFPDLSKYLSGSRGTDVTGGMLTKVSDMLDLVKTITGLSIRIIDGTKPDTLRQTLLGENTKGTKIHSGVDTKLIDLDRSPES